METNKTKKNVGNKTTEVIIGAAATKLANAVRDMNVAVLEVSKLEERVIEGTLTVTNLDDKIGGLEQDLKNKIAQNKIELQQQYDTDKKAFVTGWLTSNDMALIANSEVKELKESLVEAQMNLDEKVSKAVGAATGSLKSEHNNQIKIMQLEHEKKESHNSAQIQQLENQIKFLNEQVTMWKNALDDERKASVERAKASSIGTLNIGAQQGR